MSKKPSRKSMFGTVGGKGSSSNIGLFNRQTSLKSRMDGLSAKVGLKSKNKKLGNEITFSGLQEEERVALLICDPQNDFHAGGKLPARKADEKSQKIAQVIRTFGGQFDEIYVSLQMKPFYHISHPCFWTDTHGKNPEPSVHITAEDVRDKVYFPVRKEHDKWVVEYFKQLEKKGLHNLVIFPPNCLIGTKGAAIVDCVSDALMEWEDKYKKAVHYVYKNTNSRSEQFSLFQTIIPVKDDDGTTLNKTLLNKLQSFEKLFICGHSMSHSVKFTVNDMLEYSNKNDAEYFVLQDCCATFSDFKNVSVHWLEELKEKNGISAISSSQVGKIIEGGNIVDQTMFSLAQSSNFFDGETTLGDGCYLLYDNKNYGLLYEKWTRTKEEIEVLKSSYLAYFKPGTSFRVPEFKYRNEGIFEVSKEMSKGGQKQKKMFQGLLRFIADCKACKGTFVLNAQMVNAEINGQVFALTDKLKVVQVEFDQFEDPSYFDVVCCIPNGSHMFEGVTTKSANLFVTDADSVGAALNLPKAP